MPAEKKTDKENLASVCCVCARKGKKFQNVSQKIGKSVVKHFHPSYGMEALNGSLGSLLSSALTGDWCGPPRRCALACGCRVVETKSTNLRYRLNASGGGHGRGYSGGRD